jgi:hypothetical protein
MIRTAAAIRYLTKIGLIAVIIYLATAPLELRLAIADNSSETMQFNGQPPSTPIEVFGNAWTIFADGVIDAEAGARLRTFIQERHIPQCCT